MLDFVSYDAANPNSELRGWSTERGDGHLIGEFRLLEAFNFNSVNTNSHRPFTCNVKKDRSLECLDLTSFKNAAVKIVTKMDPLGRPTYLDMTDDSWTRAGSNGYVDLTENGANGYNESQIFGQTEQCDDGKIVGDGMLNVFDQALLLKYMLGGFEGILPSDPSVVVTGLQGRSDLHRRCDTSEMYYDYYQAYTDDSCINMHESQRRRLALVERGHPSMTVHTSSWAHIEGVGKWYQIANFDLHKSVQLRVENIRWPGGRPRTADLSDEIYPWDGLPPPFDDDLVHVRFAHECEYSGSCQGKCAIINTVLSTQIVLAEETLAYTLGTATGASNLCRVDFYIWVPARLEDTGLELPLCVSFGTAQPTRSCTWTSCTCEGVFHPRPPSFPPPYDEGGGGGNETTTNTSQRSKPPPPPPVWDGKGSAPPPPLPPGATTPGADASTPQAPPPPPPGVRWHDRDTWPFPWWILVVLAALLPCCCCCAACLVYCVYSRRKSKRQAYVHPGVLGKNKTTQFQFVLEKGKQSKRQPQKNWRESLHSTSSGTTAATSRGTSSRTACVDSTSEDSVTSA